MTEGIRKEKNLPERIARSLIQNEELFIQSLKIFANTSIVGAQGAQAGGSSGGSSGVGNYLRKDGDIMDAVFATRPSIATIANNEIDISKLTATNYTSKVFIIGEGSADDELNFIVGGVAGTTVLGAEFPGQWLIIQPIAGQEITINNDASGFGDPTATPRQNIRTPDGNPVILKNEQAVLLNFDTTSGQWSFLGAVGSSIAGDPQCFTENDLGDVSGAQTIVFNDNAFARMRAIGNTTIAFDTSKLLFGKWYKLTVEILQDPGGGHTVTFDDAPFENGIIPIVFTAGNRYTSIRFYAYKLDSGPAVRIFAFDELQPFPLQFFDGFIQARLDTDQTANLTPNKHIEFDLPITTDSTIGVSTGSGQLAGLFSNFEIGHLYQCECHYAIEGVVPSTELTVQFFNVTKGTFFGSQGRSQTTSHTLQDSNQPVAKGFFVADAISDVVEVRIRAASGIDKIIAGSGVADSTSYVVIKDCGVAGIENLEGNLVPAPEPTSAEVILPLKGYAIARFSEGSESLTLRSPLGPPSGSTGAPAMGSGKMKNNRTTISSYPASGGNLKIFTFVNSQGPQLGSGMVGIVGTPTVHDRDGLDRAFVKNDIIGWQYKRSNGIGQLIYNNWSELEYEKNELWFYTVQSATVKDTERFSELISSGIHQDNAGPSGQTRFANQRSLGRDGLIKDFLYYGTILSGTGPAIISIEVNGIVVFDSPDLPNTGLSIHRFDNVNILINENDLVNIKFIARARGGAGATGSFGTRVVLL